MSVFNVSTYSNWQIYAATTTQLGWSKCISLGPLSNL